MKTDLKLSKIKVMSLLRNGLVVCVGILFTFFTVIFRIIVSLKNDAGVGGGGGVCARKEFLFIGRCKTDQSDLLFISHLNGYHCYSCTSS